MPKVIYEENFNQAPVQQITKNKKRFPGCLIFLLVIVLFCGGVYLLFSISPIEMEEKPTGSVPLVYGDLTERQQDDFNRLIEASRSEPEIYEESGAIRSAFIDVDMGFRDDPEMQVEVFMREYQELYKIRDFSQEFILIELQPVNNGGLVLKYIQQIDSIPVYSSGLSIGIDNQGKIKIINGAYLPDDYLSYDKNPEIDLESIVQLVISEGYIINTENQAPSLILYNEIVLGKETGGTKLAWILDAIKDGNQYQIVVSAVNGEILMESQSIKFADYGIYDFNNIEVEKLFDKECGQLFDGATIIYDTNWADGPDLDSKYDKLNSAIDKTSLVYRHILDWNGYDNQDSRFLVFVSILYNSPFRGSWCEQEIIAFTDQASLETPHDIFPHEFQHGVTDVRVGLAQSKATAEAGALDEAYSDIFTTLVDTEHPWQIYWGDKLLRDMQNPARADFQIDHLNDFITRIPFRCKLTPWSCLSLKGDEKYGFSHKNSTIISHAAYLFSEGGRKRGIEVEGVGIEDMAVIFFNGQEYLPPNATFFLARWATLQACEDYYGDTEVGNFRCDQLRNAFAIVGIGDPTPQPSTTDKLKERMNEVISQIEDLREGLIDELNKKLEESGVEIENYRRKLEEDLFNLVMEMIFNWFLGYIERLMEQLINGFCGSIAFVLIPAMGILFVTRKK